MSSLRRAVRRSVAALALTGVLAGTAIVSDVRPASAAPPASAFVCFVFPNGVPYTGPVYAQPIGFTGWQSIPATRSVNGCTSWVVESGYSWRFLAYAPAYQGTVEGASPWIPMYYPGQYNVGTWVVTQHWAPPGYWY